MDIYEKAFESIQRTAAGRIKHEDGDYIQDGLLYCGKCHTRKQTRIEILGKIKEPYCLCECEKALRDHKEAETKQKELMLRVQRMRSAGFPDKEMQDWRFENDDGQSPQIMWISQNYVDNFSTMLERKKGLLLYGSVGSGKTFAAASIVNALIDKGVPALITNFARLVNTIQGMKEGKQQYLDSLNNYKLLVIDDLAAERDTEYMQEIVTNIIDARYRSGLPLIITTNLTSEQLKNPADISKQRIYSRLFEMCIPIEVHGKDRRKEKLKNDFDEFNKILGINTDKTK